MSDLQVVIEGYTSLVSTGGNGDVVGTLARHCSIFLRKTALGDSRNPRLLDSETCETIGLLLGRISKPPAQTEILKAVDLAIKMDTRLTHIHSETSRVADGLFHAGPWSFVVKVDWPLPGVLDWPSHLTPGDKLPFDPRRLFSNRGVPSCDQWVGQQLLICDGVAVSLADVIRFTANTDGAHAPVTFHGDLSRGGRKSPAKKEKEDALLVLHGIEVCVLRYTQLITVYAGLYLYLALINSKVGESLARVIGIPTFEICPPVPSLGCSVVSYRAGIPLPITGRENFVHTIRNVR